jgi:hypothetical protein
MTKAWDTASRIIDLVRLTRDNQNEQAISDDELKLADKLGISWNYMWGGLRGPRHVSYLDESVVPVHIDWSECYAAARDLWPKDEKSARTKCDCGAKHDSMGIHSDWCSTITTKSWKRDEQY